MYIKAHTVEPYITIVNKRGGAKRKRRYVAMTGEVCRALRMYESEHANRVIERHG